MAVRVCGGFISHGITYIHKQCGTAVFNELQNRSIGERESPQHLCMLAQLIHSASAVGDA